MAAWRCTSRGVRVVRTCGRRYLEGILGIAAGLVAFFWPGTTALVLLFVIAAWAILTGVMEVIGATRMRHVITNEWALIFAGVLSVVFGILLGDPARCRGPDTGLAHRPVRAVILGIAMLVLAWRLRDVLEKTDRVSTSAPHAKPV